MKKSTFWIIAAFLFGISVFGILNSIYLSIKNSSLQQSVMDFKAKLYEVNARLEKSDAALNETRVVLSQTQESKVQLEGQIEFLESRLAKKEKELKDYEENALNVAAKLKETTEVNLALFATNNQVAKELLLSELKRNEMASKLASISELKKQIVYLKRQRKKKAMEQRVLKKKLAGQADYRKESVLKPGPDFDAELEGNLGFVVKDGKSTFADRVDIKVRPVEFTGNE